MIFALRVFGKSSTNFTASGLSGLPSCSATLFRSSSRRSSLSAPDDFNTQKQTSAAPLIGSGTPIAAASLTAGWPARIDSTSAGPNLWPAILIVSSERPRMYHRPSLSTAAQSPWTHTSSKRLQSLAGDFDRVIGAAEDV